eukprot:m.391381 g.391381  ORF g.391381 m.391381 type:complete len:59 (-) comp21074_c0_seq14:118-294(-)
MKTATRTRICGVMQPAQDSKSLSSTVANFPGISYVNVEVILQRLEGEVMYAQYGPPQE